MRPPAVHELTDNGKTGNGHREPQFSSSVAIISIALQESSMRLPAVLLLALAACAPVAPPNGPPPIDEEHPRLEWGLVLHGGAGVTRTSYSAAELPLMEAAFHAALRAGHAILARGGSSLDTVEAAVRV